MKRITVTAPAKINLTLDITGKRQDGFHMLSTIMQSISLSDMVFIELNDSGKIFFECKADGIPDGKENIAYRAAKTFLDCSDVSCGGLYISVNKAIPFQAGLGGGSADCAAVLVGLNRLLDTGYSKDEICEIGVKLGADVPFCIIGGTKICRGIGEVITDAPMLESCYIAVAKGGKGISTKAAYEEIDLQQLFGGNDTPEKFDGSIRSLKEIGGNVFENTNGCRNVHDIQ
ncbi:MAG: 4-(cytidine 5'-diphospho)-2-C-methyl-D-erythritol kinase, partial [Oscillospiraceae bacterium]|nr:4-(cytidine 5'-diphospho)-2-C-methyl-D-erythritol kinase [Oscillospiraceae bacterium]